MEQIPYIAFESTTSRLERANRRLWILCIILVFLLLATNIAWIIYEAQFIEEVQIEQEIESEDSENFITGIGDISYGQNED